MCRVGSVAEVTMVYLAVRCIHVRPVNFHRFHLLFCTFRILVCEIEECLCGPLLFRVEYTILALLLGFLVKHHREQH